MNKEITQQEFDELIEWLRNFKDVKLFEIDNDLKTLSQSKQEYGEKIQLFHNNVFNDSIFKAHGLHREINELIRYVSIVFEYLENKHKH